MFPSSSPPTTILTNLLAFLNTPRGFCMFLFFRSTYDRCSSVGVELGQVSPVSPLHQKPFPPPRIHLASHVCQGWRKIWVVVTPPPPHSHPTRPNGPMVTLTSHLAGRAHRIQPGEQKSGSSAATFAGCKQEFSHSDAPMQVSANQANCDQPTGR